MTEKRMIWHKVDSLRWLDGSIRSDLEPAERGVWADLLALAALTRRRGYIERSEGIPYKRQHLAERFDVPLKLLNSTITKCIKEGRITKAASGVLYITNWEYYQAVPPEKKRPTAKQMEHIKKLQLLKLLQEYPDVAKEVIEPMYVDTDSGLFVEGLRDKRTSG